MKEIDEFKKFFKDKGVKFREWSLNNIEYKGVNPTCHIITVSQAHFHFDEKGRYVGVEDDEMGGWHERNKV